MAKKKATKVVPATDVAVRKQPQPKKSKRKGATYTSGGDFGST